MQKIYRSINICKRKYSYSYYNVTKSIDEQIKYANYKFFSLMLFGFTALSYKIIGYLKDDLIDGHDIKKIEIYSSK